MLNLERQHNILAAKVIRDTLWFAPTWFQDHVGSKFERECLDFHSGLIGTLAVSPKQLVLWASSNLKDSYIYNRILGAITQSVMMHFNPIAIYAGMQEQEDVTFDRDFINKCAYKFMEDIYGVRDLLWATRIDFGKYEIESLDSVLGQCQANLFGKGEDLLKKYQANTSAVSNLDIFIDYYNTVVNFTLYAWSITAHSQTREFICDKTQENPRLKVLEPIGEKIWKKMKKLILKSSQTSAVKSSQTN